MVTKMAEYYGYFWDSGINNPASLNPSDGYMLG
jgi:hypothetical protein